MARADSGLPEQISEKIIQLILDEHLEQGDRLPKEAVLVERLGAGRSTVREAMKLHAKAMAAARVGDATDEEERKRRAFTMTAELMLMQHTCHWFCRGRTVASMRLLARHKTAYEQVLQSVAPATLKAYQKLVNARS